MAKNGLATLTDDNQVTIASRATGRGQAGFTGLAVCDDGTPMLVSSGGAQTVAIAAGTNSDTVVKGTPGRLCRIGITALAGVTTGNTSIFDNASGHTGTALVVIPNNTAVATFIDVQMPAANGITVNGSANSPGMTISFV